MDPEAIVESETDGEPTVEEQPDILIIRDIDPCIQRNGTEHHTDRFEVMNREFEPLLVVRRGQSFYLDITLSREYDPERDGVSFIFTVDGKQIIALTGLKSKG